MDIFNFADYKLYLKTHIKSLPKSGRGTLAKLAGHLDVAPMIVSHVLTRDRHFTPEQALKIADFFFFNESETEYFVYMVSKERADTMALKRFYSSKLETMASNAKNIKNLVDGGDEITDLDKGVFYSNWYYSGVRLLTSIKDYQNAEAIASYFGLGRKKFTEILSFLVKTGLCTQNGGVIKMGIKSTHVADDSEFVNSHRRNWRLKAMESFSKSKKDNFFYSSPMSLSKADAEAFRLRILEVIKDLSKTVKDSPAEKLMCFNVDWFEF
jgi:uncharacterized protein (TIGR02147 family)